MANGNGDRHKDKWHASVRDVPPDVWDKVRTGAAARRTNIGTYLTRIIQFTEEVRALDAYDFLANDYRAAIDDLLTKYDLHPVEV